MRWNLCHPFALASLLLLAPSAAQAITPAFPDVAYAVVEDTPLLLDIFLPPGEGPFPLVLWIHGGGWAAGDKTVWDGMVLPFTESGIAFASLEYRLTTDGRFANRIHPAQIHDVKGAVRFLREHAAQYALDPNRMAAWGGSAGGHLAALLGTSGGDAFLEGDVGGNLERSSRVCGVADYFGPSDMEVFAVQNPWAAGPDGPLSLFYGHPIGDILAHWEDPAPPYPDLVALVVSSGPVHLVDPADPPLFIAHGEEDEVVSVLQSDELDAAYRAAGAPCEFYRVPGAGHDMGAMPLEETFAFLRAALALPDLMADFAQVPESPTDATPVTVTASASGGLPPYTFAWDLAGERTVGPTATRLFPPGSNPVRLTVTDAGGGETSVERVFQVGHSVQVDAARVHTSPFRLTVDGSGFEEGCQIQMGGVAAPSTVFKNSGRLVAKGGAALRAMLPKGVTVSIVVVTADGRGSEAFAFTR